MSDPEAQRDALASMSKALKRLIQLVADDARYKLDAYVFVENALAYAQQQLKMGGGPVVEKEPGPKPSGSGRKKSKAEDKPSPPRHVTGQELCQAIRLFAIDQYGLMAKLVLNSWGIHSTGDFGEIVYNMIKIGRLHKSESDRRADFDDVYDFEVVFQREFQIVVGSEE